jgi:hypothetical protein
MEVVREPLAKVLDPIGGGSRLCPSGKFARVSVLCALGSGCPARIAWRAEELDDRICGAGLHRDYVVTCKREPQNPGGGPADAGDPWSRHQCRHRSTTC